MSMSIDINPVMESVYLTHAPDAMDIWDIATHNTPSWLWATLTYAELAQWADEISTGEDTTLIDVTRPTSGIYR